MKADLVVSFGSMTVAFAAWLLGKPTITFTDTEHATEQHMLFKPFSTLVATPDVYRGDFGPKHVRYRAYHELFYLHPEEFTPDWKQLEPLGLTTRRRRSSSCASSPGGPPTTSAHTGSALPTSGTCSGSFRHMGGCCCRSKAVALDPEFRLDGDDLPAGESPPLAGLRPDSTWARAPRWRRRPRSWAPRPSTSIP